MYYGQGNLYSDGKNESKREWQSMYQNEKTMSHLRLIQNGSESKSLLGCVIMRQPEPFSK